VRVLELSTHVKCFSRSKGHNAIAAAAYRAGECLTCDRTNTTYDYSPRRQSVVASGLIFPSCTAPIDRKSLWNAVETHERRQNSRIAREWMFALPASLSASERLSMAQEMACYLVKRHGIVVDYAIHAPPAHGDDRNHHVHMLMTTRRMENGILKAKARELDSQDSGAIIKQWREKVAELANTALSKRSIPVHVEHRSFRERGITRTPERHRGKTRQKPSLLKNSLKQAFMAAIKNSRAHFWVFAKPVLRSVFKERSKICFRYAKTLGQGSNATPDTQLKVRAPPSILNP
jgi:hypothetical protein